MDKRSRAGRVGRPQAPVRQDQPVLARFCEELRQLRDSADKPPKFDAMAARAGVTKSTISRATSGRFPPAPSWPSIEAWIIGCEADPEPWRARYDALIDELKAVPTEHSPPQGDGVVTITTLSEDDLVRELREVRRAGLLGLSKLALPALSVAAANGEFGRRSGDPYAVESLLRAAVAGLSDQAFVVAAEYLFGLRQGTAGWSSRKRREQAAEVFDRSPDTFRKERETDLMYRVAREIARAVQREEAAPRLDRVASVVLGDEARGRVPGRGPRRAP